MNLVKNLTAPIKECVMFGTRMCPQSVIQHSQRNKIMQGGGGHGKETGGGGGALIRNAPSGKPMSYIFNQYNDKVIRY